MGRGLGTTQRMILDHLDPREGRTVADLAERCERSPRQVRTAVTALEHRGLAVTELRQIGWSGEGRYGPLASRTRLGHFGYIPGRDSYPDLPTALTVKAGELLPRTRNGLGRLNIDTEWVRIGMPVYGLWVWAAQDG